MTKGRISDAVRVPTIATVPRRLAHSAGEWVRRLDPDPAIDVERTAMLHWLASLGDMDELPSV